MKQQKGFSSLDALLLIVVILFVGFAGWYAYHNKHNSTESSSTLAVNSNSSCKPISATTLDETLMVESYKLFARAVATKNQSCANALVTDRFNASSKQIFSAPDGKWITAKPGGSRAIYNEFSQLPSKYNDANFKVADYGGTLTQAQYANNVAPVTGKKLSYPVDLSKYTGDNNEKWQITLSFGLENGSIKVDDFIVEPQA